MIYFFFLLNQISSQPSEKYHLIAVKTGDRIHLLQVHSLWARDTWMRHLSKFAETSESRGAVVALKVSSVLFLSLFCSRESLLFCFAKGFRVFALSHSQRAEGTHAQDVGQHHAARAAPGRRSVAVRRRQQQRTRRRRAAARRSRGPPRHGVKKINKPKIKKKGFSFYVSILLQLGVRDRKRKQKGAHTVTLELLHQQSGFVATGHKILALFALRKNKCSNLRFSICFFFLFYLSLAHERVDL